MPVFRETVRLPDSFGSKEKVKVLVKPSGPRVYSSAHEAYFESKTLWRDGNGLMIVHERLYSGMGASYRVLRLTDDAGDPLAYEAAHEKEYSGWEDMVYESKWE